MSDLTSCRLMSMVLAASAAGCAGILARTPDRPIWPEPTPLLLFANGVAPAGIGAPAYDGDSRIVVTHSVGGRPTTLAVFGYASEDWTETGPAIPGFTAWHAGAQISADGNTLYFESTDRSPAVTGREDTDLWIADRVGDAWGNARPLGAPFDTPHNEHNVTLSARATICFNSNRREITAGHDVLCARRTRDGWETPQPLGAGVNGPSADIEPLIDSEERFLLFASNRSGGKGSFDLYISVNRGGVWQPAVPLTGAINTAASESSPTVSRDGRRLLFARSEGGRNVLYECSFDPRWLDVRP